MNSTLRTPHSTMVRPGYKQTEVGVIPEEWEIIPFRELFAFKNGVNADRDSYGAGVRFINVLEPIAYSHLYGPEIPGRVTLPEAVAISFAVRRGDVLFNRTSETELELGLAATYLGTERVVFGGFVIRGRPTDESFDPMYSGYALRAPLIRSQVIPMGQGAIRANIGQQNLAQVIALVPPLPEQRAIAEALSDVDGLLGGLDRLIAKKRDLKQAAMQQLLAGQTRLPGFHGEWEMKRLGDVIHLIRGGIYGEEKPRAELRGFSVATTAHIEQDDTWNNKEMPVRYFTAEKLRDYATVEGDLIVVKSSGSAASIQSGKLGFIDAERTGKFVFSNFLMLLRPTAVLPKFLYFYLCSHNVKKLLPTLVESSTYPNIRLCDYLDVGISVPSPSEQTAIAEALSNMDAELAALEQRREKTRALKQAMMQELLTGKTRLVSPQEPHA